MLSDPNSVVEAFMKNEVYFRQLMRQRQEALAKLESGINEAVADVAACKDKNSILARKLRDLDQTIEKERKKWRERVEEEKLLVQRSVHSSARVNPGSTSTLQVATTTRSVSQIATTLRPSH
jgi:gas vesicle protein